MYCSLNSFTIFVNWAFFLSQNSYVYYLSHNVFIMLLNQGCQHPSQQSPIHLNIRQTSSRIEHRFQLLYSFTKFQDYMSMLKKSLQQ